MLYRIGTKAEVQTMQNKLPESVYKELLRCTAVLDEAYGAERNYVESGGYSLIAETDEDITEVKNIIDYENHLCEWLDLWEGSPDYVTVLYLMNNDYSIVLFMPLAIIPNVIQKELEEFK